MTDKTLTPKRGWKTYLLAGSVGLNVLLIGLIAGSAIKGPQASRGGAGVQQATRSLVHALPAEKRKELRALYKSKRGKGGADRRLVRKLNADLTAAIKAVPFDKPALVAAFDAREAVMRKSGNVGRDAMIDIIASLSDQERAQLAESMAKRKPRQKKSR